MRCHTIIGKLGNIDRVCGHSVTQHEGDESGMGGPEPCMISGCACENFVRGPGLNATNYEGSALSDADAVYGQLGDPSDDGCSKSIPPMPVFQEPPSFHCGMNEDD